jgi:hypothetical protein
MVRVGLLEESLKVVCGWPRLVLDTAPDGRDVLLVGVVHFLVVVIVVAGRNCKPLRMPLSPLLAAFGIHLGALDGDAGWRRSATAGDRFPAAWDRERPSHLLIGGVLDGDIEQILDGVPNDII